MEAFGHLRMYLDGTDGSADKRLKRTSLEELRHIHNSQRIAQIRLVTAELQHGLFVTDDRERCLGDPAAFGSKFLKGIMQYFLTDLEDILLGHEAHLEVQLIELSGRSVCSGILITKAGSDLEILIEAGSHEQLLILLRCLYNKWLGDQAKPSHRELLRVAIDNALSQSPADFEELLKLLQEYGCEVSKRGKSYRLKLSGWEKAARMDSLGEGYGLEDLRAVLLGKKAHIPRKKTVTQAEPLKINLLVDIQAKLQAGKGAGYTRWAKVFNLKQMAQTMNYLSENNLLEYAVLEEKAAAATAHHNDLSAQIKAAEKRMAEIAVLRTHIVNYAKTREVYVAYRKAGYSKKFREEHEEEILLHQAAKNAFDEMGVKKLPKVKELQTEYAKLLEEKKKTYAEYRRSREEMRELLTAKANVDRVLKMEVEQDVEKEKDHGKR